MKRLGFALSVVAVALTVAPAVASAADTITPMCTTAHGTAPCAPGWYQTPVLQLLWAWSAGGTPSNCNEAAYQRDAVATVSCTVSWPDGFVGTQYYTIKVELSSPTATVAPSRPPDSGGWYNHPVIGAPSATAFSGIASCTSTSYAGPDTATATLSATCVDNAGKSVTVVSAPFAYDVTPPSLSVAASPADHSVGLSWQTGGELAPLASVNVTRSPGSEHAAADTVYSGGAGGYRDTHVRNGVRYTYTITALDQAGNASTRTIVVRPGPRLLSPAANAQLSAPPMLTWTPVSHASYYNVQLYRNGKILSTWPERPRLQLRRHWRFDGRRYRLAPGRYRWFVWPGFGKRRAARYGHVIGSGTFVVVR
jgi:hypothetical protein